MNKLFPLVLCFLLGACAPHYLKPEEMSPPSTIYKQLPSNPSFNHAITLGSIQVAKKITEASDPVNIENYTNVLKNMLLQSGFEASSQDRPLYRLEASLLELDDEGWFSKDGTAKARYTLKHVKTNTIVLDETLTLSAHVPYSLFSDAAERIRLSKALAMREYITHLLRLLASTPVPLTPNNQGD